VSTFTILIPSIIDLECAKINAKSIYENIVCKNANIDISIIIHIDNNNRNSDDKMSDICDEYISYFGNTVEIIQSKTHVGLPAAMSELFRAGLGSDSDFYIIIEDDSEVINYLNIGHIIDNYDESSMYRAAFTTSKYSSENPFITDVVVSAGNNIRGLVNNRTFCSQNGSIFSHKLLDIISDSIFSNRSAEPENVIGHKLASLGMDVITYIYADEEDGVRLGESKLFKLPQANHFLKDGVRIFRRVGWEK